MAAGRGRHGKVEAAAADAADGLRLDRCLWCARLYKTRSLAADAVAGGHVQLNGARVKPARAVAAGDRLRISFEGRERELDVLAIPARRGPASEARICYAETPDSITRGERLSAARRLDALSRPRSEGRPDKKERRELRALARRQGSE